MERLKTELWDEFLELPLTEARAELSGFLSVLPSWADGGNVLVDTRGLKVARRMLKLCRFLGEGYNGSGGAGSLELDKNKGRAMFRIPRELYSLSAKPARKRWDWFRGVWGGCGALYTPQQGYYMALRVPGGRNCGASISSSLLSVSVVPRVRVKRSRTEFMIRDIEGVVTILSRMGLVRTSLLLEDTAVIRSVRGMANKMVNCDSANIASTLAAARTQIALVDAIDENGLWSELPPHLAEVARLRRENPSASLRELGQILSKPVSKSTVEYRWRKLVSVIGEKI
ncbi:MAG: DNA-binding protein WhiA [Synergistaceae bacterium]|jgi:DNA-binding protein WhiA|nr:DNA-binding protein WhiA [Synergistaceae bacterium]